MGVEALKWLMQRALLSRLWKKRSQRGRLEEEMNWTAEPTQKKILELEGAIAALRAEHSITAQGGDNAMQHSTKDSVEQNKEGSSNRRTSPYKKKSKRWDWKGEDERKHEQLVTDVSEATAQVVRYGSRRGKPGSSSKKNIRRNQWLQVDEVA